MPYTTRRPGLTSTIGELARWIGIVLLAAVAGLAVFVLIVGMLALLFRGMS